jgi:hypothetical protein
VGNPAEETYCYPNIVNSMTGSCFVNTLRKRSISLVRSVPYPVRSLTIACLWCVMRSG